MAKIAQLVEGDYNMLDNIPVINQDLSASGFTPVANTYYRHTGATTDTFTQGVIYLYDTAYHKLGESCGGTTLNRYIYSISNLDNLSESELSLITKIMINARHIGGITVLVNDYVCKLVFISGGSSDVYLGGINANNNFSYSHLLISKTLSPSRYRLDKTDFTNGAFVTSNLNGLYMEIIYYNDTEITA